jgi:hypothetical protein
MIPTTSFAEKSDQASRFFVLNRSLRAASPRPSGTGDRFLFLRTGAEAPAYSRSASPRRGRFYSSAIHCLPKAEAVPPMKKQTSPKQSYLLASQPSVQISFNPKTETDLTTDSKFQNFLLMRITETLQGSWGFLRKHPRSPE